ncbi:MAG: ABC transporter substrate-binding protein [Chloroflexota bacterium]|nr:ABC transporter substrate-binding protein [Chloroflexota bacterium]
MKPSTKAMWWQIVALLSVVSMVLAACGSPLEPGALVEANAADTAATAEAPTASAASSTPPPSANASPGRPRELVYNQEIGGTIDFWHFWGSTLRRDAIRSVIALCKQKLPNITVNETFKPFGDIWTANIAAVSSGSGMPDVIVEDRPKLPDRAINGIAQPISNFAERDGLDDSQFWPFTWEQTIYEGQSYGVPFETDVRVLYYNKTAFKEAGLDPDKPPQTWDDLVQYADKLDKKNATGGYERIAFFPLINMGPDVWGYTNGVEWMTKDGLPQINTPQAVETMAWIKTWVDRYGGWPKIQAFRASFQAPPKDAFMSGRVAMFVDINGYSSQLNLFDPQITTPDGKVQDLEWGVTHLPYKVKRGSWSGGFALSIPRGAKNPDTAWEFIKCATSREAQTSWASDTRSMPAHQQAANDPVLLADPHWQLFVDAMSYSNGSVFVPKYANWMEQLDMRYEQIWRGELEPGIALEQAQQIVEQELSK